jgi:hypothetical protein
MTKNDRAECTKTLNNGLVPCLGSLLYPKATVTVRAMYGRNYRSGVRLGLKKAMMNSSEVKEQSLVASEYAQTLSFNVKSRCRNLYIPTGPIPPL